MLLCTFRFRSPGRGPRVCVSHKARPARPPGGGGKIGIGGPTPNLLKRACVRYKTAQGFPWLKCEKVTVEVTFSPGRGHMGETQIREGSDQLSPSGQPLERGGGRRETCQRGQQDEIRQGLRTTEGN